MTGDVHTVTADVGTTGSISAASATGPAMPVNASPSPQASWTLDTSAHQHDQVLVCPSKPSFQGCREQSGGLDLVLVPIVVVVAVITAGRCVGRWAGGRLGPFWRTQGGYFFREH
jgi:hypothetical protein